jgi:hypothetical protein
MGTILRGTKYHGTADLGLSRYFTLYFTQLGWIMLGVYLLKNAYWPSSCRPEGLLEIYTCSMRLPESRNWVEAALLTWLWSTPILIALDVSRRYRAWQEKRADKPVHSRRKAS